MDPRCLQVKTECALSTDTYHPEVCGIYHGTRECNFFQSAMAVLDGAGATSSPLLPAFLSLVDEAKTNKGVLSWDRLPFGKPPRGFKGYDFILRELFKKLAEIYKAGNKSCRDKISKVLDQARIVLQNRRKAVKVKGHLDEKIREQHEYVIKLWKNAIDGLEKVMKACEGTAVGRKMDHQNDHEHGGSGSGIKSSSNRDTSGSNQSKSSARPVSPVRRTCRDEYLAGPPGNSYAKSTAGSLVVNSKISHPETYAICSEEVEFLKKAMKIIDGARPTSPPLLPQFLDLMDGSKDGIIIFWDRLPFKNRASSGPAGYAFVIRELFNTLGQIYKDGDIDVKCDIMVALSSAQMVRHARNIDVILCRHQGDPRHKDLEDVVSLWETEIERLQQQVKQDCEGTSGRTMDHRNAHEQEGSGSGTKRSSNRDTSGSNQSKSPARPVSPARPTCRDEYQEGPPGNSYAKSTADSLALNSNISHPKAYAIYSDGDEFRFFKKAMATIDAARPTSPPLLPAFRDLVDGSKDGIIICWDRLPFKNRASSGPTGYAFVLRELFNTLGEIYKDGDTSARVNIIWALFTAEQVRITRKLDMFFFDQGDPRHQDLQDVVSLWETEIERLQQQVKQDCEGTSGRTMDHRDVHEQEGSGSGTAYRRGLPIVSFYPKYRSVSPVPSDSFKDEYQWRRPSHSYRKSTADKVEEVVDVGTRAVAAIGGVAAGGVGVGVVLNSIAATTGAGKSAPAITAFAASPVGQAIAVGTDALGAPAVLLASAAAAGGLLGFALRKK